MAKNKHQRSSVTYDDTTPKKGDYILSESEAFDMMHYQHAQRNSIKRRTTMVDIAMPI